MKDLIAKFSSREHTPTLSLKRNKASPKWELVNGKWEEHQEFYDARDCFDGEDGCK